MLSRDHLHFELLSPPVPDRNEAYAGPLARGKTKLYRTKIKQYRIKKNKKKAKIQNTTTHKNTKNTTTQRPHAKRKRRSFVDTYDFTLDKLEIAKKKILHQNNIKVYS